MTVHCYVGDRDSVGPKIGHIRTIHPLYTYESVFQPVCIVEIVLLGEAVLRVTRLHQSSCIYLNWYSLTRCEGSVDPGRMIEEGILGLEMKE